MRAHRRRRSPLESLNRYLLDSGVLAGYLQGRSRATQLVAPWIAQREAATSVLVYAEIVEYIKSLPDFTRRELELRSVLRVVRPYFLTYAILRSYADIRRALRQPHGPGLIGDIETLIAATALEHDLTVETTDNDCQRVPQLRTMIVTMRH